MSVGMSGDHRDYQNSANHLGLSLMAGSFTILILLIAIYYVDLAFFGNDMANKVLSTLSNPEPGLDRAIAYALVVIWVSVLFATFIFLRKHEEGEILITGQGIEKGTCRAINKEQAIMMKAPGDGPGIRVGKLSLSRAQERTHMLIIGSPRSGKSVFMKGIVSYVFRELKQDRIVIHDIKGDFTKSTPGNPIIFGPTDARTWGWEIGKDVRTQAHALQAAASWIPESKGGDPSWTSGARQVLAALIFHLLHEYGEEWRISNLSEVLSNGESELARLATEAFPATLALLTRDAETGGLTKTAQGYISTMATSLVWVHQLASAETAIPDDKWLSFREYTLNSKEHLILKSDATHEAAVSAIFAMVLQVIADTYASPLMEDTNPTDPGTWFFIDEIPQLGKVGIEAVKKIQEVGAGRGARVVSAAQNFYQFDEKIGREEAKAFVNLQSIRVYSRTSEDQADDISKNSGKKQILRKGSSEQNQVRSDSVQISDVEVITKEDLTRLKVTSKGPEVIVVANGLISKIVIPFPSSEKYRERYEENILFNTIVHREKKVKDSVKNTESAETTDSTEKTKKDKDTTGLDEGFLKELMG